MKNNFFEVICIKDCKTYGGAKFFKNRSYKCHIIDDWAHVYNENNDMIKLEIKSMYNNLIFSTYFSSLKEERKNKLIKLNKLKNDNN